MGQRPRKEDALLRYLEDQKAQGQLVYGVYSPKLCQIYKKKKYFCIERRADIEFDVVIEVFRAGSQAPHLYVIFECKNHKSPISEARISEFSDKLSRIGRHNAKGVVVSSTRLQSGAQNVAVARGLGIVKYDETGLDVIAERRGGLSLSESFVKAQIFETQNAAKSLKFSAYFDGKFFGAVGQFLANLGEMSSTVSVAREKAPYLSSADLRTRAQEILYSIGYSGGAVDLQRVCKELSLRLEFTGKSVVDLDGSLILGLANFSNRSIHVNSHEDRFRERFTVAHEIGHFALQHDRYLNSEAVIEKDFFCIEQDVSQFDYQRLETQANILASELLLPMKEFGTKVHFLRANLAMQDRGHGYIFVDDQPCNYVPYNELLSELKSYFQVSKHAIEIKLKLFKLISDDRQQSNWKKVQ